MQIGDSLSLIGKFNYFIRGNFLNTEIEFYIQPLFLVVILSIRQCSTRSFNTNIPKFNVFSFNNQFNTGYNDIAN